MLEIRLFGSPQVIVDGKPQSKIPTRKSVLLLARLVLNPSKPQDRNALAFELWPDVLEARARRNLNTEVWRLKQALGEAIIADSKSVQFAPAADCFVDVRSFEAVAVDVSIEELEKAISNYHGDFLAGYYDDWVLVKREAYQDCLMQYLDQCARHYQANSSPRRAIEYVRRILFYNPLHEESHQRLMRLFVQAGDYASAIQQYRQCTELLERELGLKPMPETEALFQRIAMEAQKQTAQPSPIVQPERVFVGRGDAVRALNVNWEAVLNGRTQSVIVTGESGIGKTRLVEHWLEGIRHRGILLRGRCYEVDQRVPFRPITEMFRSAVQDYGDEELRNLSAIAKNEIGKVIPELRLAPLKTDSAELPPAQAHERSVNSLAKGLCAWSAPEKPLVLFLDDMQWADDETMDVVRALFSSGTDLPMLLIATHRPDPLTVVADRSKRLPEVESTTLTLDPLSRGEVAELIRKMGNLSDTPQEFAEHIFAETEGNPLFIVESLRGLFDSGHLSTNADGIWSVSLDRSVSGMPRLPLSSNLRQTILKRVERLNADQRELLALAAVIGKGFDVRFLQSITGMNDAAIQDALTGLSRYGLIRDSSPKVFDFSHVKIQEVLFATMTDSKRRDLHLQVAGYLEARTVDEASKNFEQLAYHFQQGGDEKKALDYFAEAGEQAMKLHAYRVGAEHFASAVSLCKDSESLVMRFELRMKLYTCQWTIESDHEKLQTILDQARKDAEQIGKVENLARVYFFIGINLVSRGSWDEAREKLQNALEFSIQSGLQEYEMKTRIELANILGHLMQDEEALQHATVGLRIARQLQDFRMEGRARWDIIERNATPAKLAEEGLRIIDEAIRKDAIELIIDLGSESVGVLWRAGNLGGAISLGERILEYGRQRGIEKPLIRSVQRALSRVYCEIGEYEHAHELAKGSLRESRLSNYRYGEMRALVCLASSNATLGNLEEALTGFRRASDLCAQIGSKTDSLVIRLATASALVWFGDTRHILTTELLLREIVMDSRSLGSVPTEVLALSYLSRIFLSADRFEEALQASEAALEIVEGANHKNFPPEPLVYFLHFLALHHSRDATAASHLRRARDLLCQRAATLPPRLRRSFLRRVPLHFAISQMRGY